MKREIIKTADGSATIFLPEWREHYHSRHGAVQEARHVFLEMGLQAFVRAYRPDELHILEMGFGTGLNALLTSIEAEVLGVAIHYSSVEAYPVAPGELHALNYPEVVDHADSLRLFTDLHDAAWEKEVQITPFFSIQKERKFFSEVTDQERFDLIFFDAFGPRVQPELWSEKILRSMFRALRNNGILVTYCAKGSVRRLLQEVGFTVERLPGPPGKREMLRGRKS